MYLKGGAIGSVRLGKGRGRCMGPVYLGNRPGSKLVRSSDVHKSCGQEAVATFKRQKTHGRGAGRWIQFQCQRGSGQSRGCVLRADAGQPCSYSLCRSRQLPAGQQFNPDLCFSQQVSHIFPFTFLVMPPVFGPLHPHGPASCQRRIIASPHAHPLGSL